MAKHISQYFFLGILCIVLVLALGKKHMNFEPQVIFHLTYINKNIDIIFLYLFLVFGICNFFFGKYLLSSIVYYI